MSDLVGNPEDRFSHDAAHIHILCVLIKSAIPRLHLIMKYTPYLSHVMRKPAFSIYEKQRHRWATQGNHAADKHHNFHFIASTIPLLPKSEISGDRFSPEAIHLFHSKYFHIYNFVRPIFLKSAVTLPT